MNAVVTRYSPSDQPSVKKLILEELAKFGFSYNSEYDQDLENPQKYYLNKGGMFYVLKIREQVMGTIAIINHEEYGELKRLYLKEDLQGKGFGTKLLEQALKFCNDHNLHKIKLETNKKFLKAHAFYQKHGFKIISEDENSYYMEKKL